MIVLLLVSLVSLLIVAHLFGQYRSRRMRDMVKEIPSVKGYPFIGAALELGSNSVEYLKNMVELVEKHGSLIQLWLGPTLYVVMSDGKDAEAVLSSSTHLYKSSIYTYLRDWLGHGLITAPAPKWKKSRKMLTPAFHFKILESYISVINDNTKIMMAKLEKELGKETFDIGNHIDRCTLDVICETAMSTSVNAQLNEEAQFPKSLKVVSNAILLRAFKPWLFPDFTFKMSALGRSFYKHLKYINSFIDNVIVHKRKLLEEKRKTLSSMPEYEQISEENVYSTKKRTVFLDLLLSYAEDPSNDLTDDDIRAEVSTFMFAGHDTTSSTIGFVVYLLGKHPEVQEKVLDEVNTVFGESCRDPDYSDLLKLKYLEQVVKETLRLYPAVPYIGRTLHEDLKLPSGHTLPAEAEVVIMIYCVQRDPKVFPNPEEFNPDNFSPEKMSCRFPFSYVPFSAGPRNCIGQKFAMLEVKATVARLIQTYKVTTVPPYPVLASELILRSATGVNIRLEKRN